ncbi:protein kinase [Nocardia sp. NPDC127526]|uniref:serine/threonine-protein kinase n=1 Tax=Nocardia sp. NPDC127526 TaxID=3345393 RepID=UPI0036401401
MDGTPFGRYRLLGLLGEGGMGRVYRAYDTETDRVVALKVLPEDFAHDQGYRERFRREAQAAARLSEPHIIPIHGYGEIDGQLFLDMRLVEGTDLAAVLVHGGPLPPARAVGILEQVAAALDAAHRQGLVHRDVKPSNILIAPGDFAYLIDFGIARGDADTSLTTVGAAIGTFAYMAPERLAHERYDSRADVYSLACVLHECLTGAKPFPVDSLGRQIAAHLTLPPPRPSEAANVPGAFDAVIAQGMAKDPDERFPAAGVLAAAARAALDRENGGAPTPFRTAPTQINPLPGVPGQAGWAAGATTRSSTLPDAPTAHAASTAPGLSPHTYPATPPHDASPPGLPESPGSPKSQTVPRRGIILAAALVVLLIAGVVLAVRFTGDDSPPAGQGTTSAATGPTTAGSTSIVTTAPTTVSTTQVTTQPTTAAAAATQMANFLRSHYSSLLGNTGAAWARLTTSYQNRIGGFAGYESFWKTVATVVTSEVTANPADNTVTYQLHLVYGDGKVAVEKRVATLVPNGDSYLIDSAELVS